MLNQRLLRKALYLSIAFIIGSMFILGYAEAQTKPTPKYGGILRNVEMAGAQGSFGWPPDAAGTDGVLFTNMAPAV